MTLNDQAASHLIRTVANIALVHTVSTGIGKASKADGPYGPKV